MHHLLLRWNILWVILQLLVLCCCLQSNLYLMYLLSIQHFIILADFKGLILFNAIYLVFFAVFSVGYQHELNLSRKRRLILLHMFCLCTFNIRYLYCTWTPVGASYIVGIQTRYFVPMLPINSFNSKYQNMRNLKIGMI